MRLYTYLLVLEVADGEWRERPERSYERVPDEHIAPAERLVHRVARVGRARVPEHLVERDAQRVHQVGLLGALVERREQRVEQRLCNKRMSAVTSNEAPNICFEREHH